MTRMRVGGKRTHRLTRSLEFMLDRPPILTTDGQDDLVINQLRNPKRAWVIRSPGFFGPEDVCWDLWKRIVFCLIGHARGGSSHYMGIGER